MLPFFRPMRGLPIAIFEMTILLFLKILTILFLWGLQFPVKNQSVTTLKAKRCRWGFGLQRNETLWGRSSCQILIDYCWLLHLAAVKLFSWKLNFRLCTPYFFVCSTKIVEQWFFEECRVKLDIFHLLKNVTRIFINIEKIYLGLVPFILYNCWDYYYFLNLIHKIIQFWTRRA